MNFKYSILSAVVWISFLQSCSTGSHSRNNELQQSKCGNVKIKRRIDGPELRVDRGYFPWQASLLTHNGRFVCGGTLVSRRKVVTAASCIDNNNELFKSEDLVVWLGANDLRYFPDGDSIIVPVQIIQIHPHWMKATKSASFDIAVLMLSEDVELNDFIQPICLPDATSDADTLENGYVVGYGTDLESSMSLRQLNIQIHSRDECVAKNKFIEPFLTDYTLCVADLGACDGDYGSGLIVKDGNSFYLYGIVSLTNANRCNSTPESVYVDATKFIDWIKDVTEQEIVRNQVVLIGSPLFTSDSSYKLLLFANIFDQGGVINITIRDAAHIYKSSDLDGFKKVDFGILSDHPILKITAKTDDKCAEQSVSLKETSDRPVVFIYLNKPIYKTGDKLGFKIFVLTQKLLPYPKFEPIKVTVYDSVGTPVQEFTDVQLSDFGVYENSLEIAEEPNVGDWVIKVDIQHRKIHKNFAVVKFDQHDFEVFIDAPSVAAYVDEKFSMKIYTKSATDEFLVGDVKIDFAKQFEGSEYGPKNFVKSMDLKGSMTEVDIDFKKDLRMFSLRTDVMLSFDILVTDQFTKKSKKFLKEIEVKHKGRNLIHVTRNKYFKPGLDFIMKIKITDMYGNLDNSSSQLLVDVQYTNQSQSVNFFKAFLSSIDSKIEVNLHPQEGTTQMKVTLRFQETEHLETIDSLPSFGVNKYMQVSHDEDCAVGDELTLTIKTTGKMQSLHLVIFGQHGIIKTEEYPKATDKIKISITEDMRPEAAGLLFYVDSMTGTVVYDEFTLSLGLVEDNKLNIAVVKSAEEVEIEVKTEVGSYVFLSVIEQTSDIFPQTNGIAKAAIYNELMHYSRRTTSNTSRYHFEKINGYILEPLINVSDFLSKQIDLEEVLDSKIKEQHHQYFPDVYHEHSFVAQDSSTIIKLPELPKTLTNCKIIGISVHEDKGTAATEVQPKISVGIKIAIAINAPLRIREREILEVQLLAFSFHSMKLSATVSVEIENGIFVGKTASHKNNRTCLQFNMSDVNPGPFNVQLLPNDKPTSIDFLVSSSQLQPLRIKATIKADSKQYSSEKVIKVIAREMNKFAVMTKIIQFKEGAANESQIFPASMKHRSGIAHGNLLGQALDGLEAVFNKPLVLPEERMLKFAAAIITFKFIDEAGRSNDQALKRETKAKNDMLKGYQEAIPILQKILKTQGPTSVWFASFIAGVLIDYKSLSFDVDQNLIFSTLDFIVRQQNPDGSFPYDDLLDTQRDINNGLFRRVSQTALIIGTFLKNKENKQKFNGVVRKSLIFISKAKKNFKGNYIKFIAAYTFALATDVKSSKKVLDMIENSRSLGNPKDLALYVEELSYSILTKILLNEDPQKDVEKLISTHRHPDGKFYSPYDTVLGLQALYEYSKYKGIYSQNLIIRTGCTEHVLGLHDSKSFKIHKNDSFMARNQGHGYLQVYEHHNHLSSLLYSLDVTLDTLGQDEVSITVDFEVTNKVKSIDGLSKTNLVVLEVEMLRGYKLESVDSSSFDNFQLELQQDETVAVFYINQLEVAKKYKLILKTIKVHNIYETASQMVKIYDYYRPNLQGITYKTQDSNGFQCATIEN